MRDQGRFRGQDPDNEYAGQDEHYGQDETSSSMGGSGEHSMEQEPGGRFRGQGSEGEFTSGHGGEYPADQDEYSSDMGGGMPGRRPEESGTHGLQEDEIGGYDELPDDEIGGNW